MIAERKHPVQHARPWLMFGYPLDELETPSGREFINRCADTLRDSSVLLLPHFLQPELTTELVAEAYALKPRWHRMHGEFSPYSDDLSEGRNDHLPPNHPRRVKLPASHCFVAGDLIPQHSPTWRLYDAPAFQQFVTMVVQQEAVFPVDPMASVNYLIYEPGDTNGWHFDTTRYVISLALQLPEAGGEYQYIPNLRATDDEQEEAVAWRMRNPDNPLGVKSVSLAPGCLFFFQGLHTLHRVKPILGNRERIMAIISYHDRPGRATSDSSKMAMYGRIQ